MAAEVREDYLESLQELTVNSRPIIKTLTEIAQECVDFAPAVVDAIETHTQQCSPAYKLPALYLIDSICKNEWEAYIDLFEPRIVGIFANAFEVSSESVRIKLSDLFKTWTMPLPATGQPVFSHDTLRQLNDYMLSLQPQNGPVPTAPQQTGGRPRLNQSALMVDMNRFRSLLEQDPKDKFNELQVSLLARYEAEISGVVDPKALPVLQSQLEEMKMAREQHLANPQRNKKFNRKPANTNRRRVSGGVDKITGTNNVPLGNRKRTPSNGAHGSNGYAADTNGDIDLNIAAELAKSLAWQSQSSADIDLAVACATDATPQQIDMLYSGSLPLQCATCGYRFPNTEEGRQAKKSEMDWHFRANRDIREGHSRNRCWFLTRNLWIEYRDEDEVYGLGSHLSEAMDNSMKSSSLDANSGAEAVDLEKERLKYIDVPMASSSVCPVCQEPHEVSWSEEAENWVWMNAVDVDGHYFHATCFADPQNKWTVASVLEQKLPVS